MEYSDRLLEVDTVRVTYSGAEALRGVSLSLAAGEVVSLMGANGAGKSTLLRAISGLCRVADGSVHYRGMRIDTRPPHKIATLGIGHVPEGRALFPKMTVRENLELGFYRRWKTGSFSPAQVLDLFPELAQLLDRTAFSLSGGQQQMVAIARALIGEPDVVLLDEPSLGVAPVVVQRIVETIVALKAAGRAVLLVEQDTQVALKCCDRGYVLANGRVILEGTRAQLQNDDSLREAYIGTKG